MVYLILYELLLLGYLGVFQKYVSGGLGLIMMLFLVYLRMVMNLLGKSIRFDRAVFFIPSYDFLMLILTTCWIYSHESALLSSIGNRLFYLNFIFFFSIFWDTKLTGLFHNEKLKGDSYMKYSSYFIWLNTLVVVFLLRSPLIVNSYQELALSMPEVALPPLFILRQKVPTLGLFTCYCLSIVKTVFLFRKKQPVLSDLFH